MNQKHTLFFIHGMGDNEPLKGFEQLWSEIRRAYGRRPGSSRDAFDAHFDPAFVDWHEVTRSAKLEVFRDAFHGLDPQELRAVSLLHPIASARTFMTFFLGDVVAYVAENDNNIRRSIWASMRPRLRGDGSFSIVAHSLGSVIAFDFLFHLLALGQVFPPVTEPELDAPALQRRFHGLFTMGSPIGLFMLRNGALWRPGHPARDTPGMFSNIVNPITRGDQRWLNFWDPQDVIAYPLERLFASNPDNHGRALQDREVQTGWDPVSAHVNYWRDEGVAGAIAHALP
jgi:hypothetical protein